MILKEVFKQCDRAEIIETLTKHIKERSMTRIDEKHVREVIASNIEHMSAIETRQRCKAKGILIYPNKDESGRFKVLGCQLIHGNLQAFTLDFIPWSMLAYYWISDDFIEEYGVNKAVEEVYMELTYWAESEEASIDETKDMLSAALEGIVSCEMDVRDMDSLDEQYYSNIKKHLELVERFKDIKIPEGQAIKYGRKECYFLNDEEYALFQDFDSKHHACAKDHPDTTGALYTFSFIPTSMGTLVTVECACGETCTLRGLF